MLGGPGPSRIEPLPADPSVEVVIPARDAAPYLAATVRSVLGQTFAARRVHVIENCSRDGTLGVAEMLAQQDPRVRVVRAERCGEGAARNRGLAEAAGADLVALLDADDLWEPTFLEEVVAAYRTAPPETGVVHVEYRLVDGTGRPTSGRTRRATRSGDIFRPLLLDAYAVTGSASGAVLRAGVVREGLRFDEDLAFAADWDFWLRVARRWSFVPIRRPLVAIRVRDDSVQRSSGQDAAAEAVRLAIELEIMRRHRGAVDGPELSDAMRRRVLVRAFALRRRPRELVRFVARSRAVLREVDPESPRFLRNLLGDFRRLAASL